ncbi:hypothetical protein SAMN02745866_03139 [Alteromonadaceae bacterium Bs31]|nr:hypothetical protein SAMN02745866_03139 [Alteromonadaceae bacterium Bs31]
MYKINVSSAGILKVLVLAMFASIYLSACSSSTKVESDMGIKGAPDWVNEGNQALNDKKGRYFHGTGSAPKMSDASLQRSTADNRARAEVAQIFSSYMNILASDYSASLSDDSASVSEQALSRTIENATKLNLVGVEIIAHWKDKKTGVLYSLAELDMKKLKTVSAAADKMDPGLKAFISENADNIFDSMSKGN